MPTVIKPALPLLSEVESGMGHQFHIEPWLPLQTDTQATAGQMRSGWY